MEARMAYVVFGTFVVLVGCLTWLSFRRQQAPNGCCAPSDPQHDLRMGAAFDDENGEQSARPAP